MPNGADKLNQMNYKNMNKYFAIKTKMCQKIWEVRIYFSFYYIGVSLYGHGIFIDE